MKRLKERLLPPIDYYEVPGNRSPVLPWLLSSFTAIFSRLAIYFLPKNVCLLSFLSNKRSFLLLRFLRKIKEKPGLVVAHNPGSFYPALVAARRYQIPFGVDLEDYHPGETNNRTKSKHLTSLLKVILPKAGYITAASPLILSESRKIVKLLPATTQVILNYFSLAEFATPVADDSENVKLVWFSQNIAKGRGLEEVIAVVKKDREVALHLFGNLSQEFYKAFIEGIENIYVHEPLSQFDLHKAMSGYDAGLAIEKPSSNFNRNICLTNKLIAYFQAGLFILATKTAAQEKFLEEHPGHGMLISLNTEELERAFDNLKQNKNSIRSNAKGRFEKANDYCWEKESLKLAAIWQEVLADPGQEQKR